MKTIHKYILTDTEARISTYEDARFLHVANQHEQVTVWAEVNTLARECMQTMHVVGTGGQVPNLGIYVGSAIMADGDFVFHIYAGLPQ